jgi:large subunit ribosomal protein L22
MPTTAPERKTNERPGTRARVRHVRSSAYKAREVLDLIRGQHATRALEILEFSDRAIARTILKCLESAIANAQNNDGIADDELFVSACYADEGPTLKRWRPRARGRATRIRKRTCHITIIVSRLSADELAKLRERETSSGRAAASARRERRVARSREKAERKAAARHDHDHDHDHDEDHDHDDEHEHEHDHDHDETVDEAVTDTDESIETDESTTDESTETDATDVVESPTAGTESDDDTESTDTESTDDESTDDEADSDGKES